MTDKIVVAIAGEPKNEDGTYLMSGLMKISKWSNGRQAIKIKTKYRQRIGS